MVKQSCLTHNGQKQMKDQGQELTLRDTDAVDLFSATCLQLDTRVFLSLRQSIQLKPFNGLIQCTSQRPHGLVISSHCCPGDKGFNNEPGENLEIYTTTCIET